MQWFLSSLLLLLIIPFNTSRAEPQDLIPPWQKIKDEDGIAVYTRPVKNSTILKVKTEMVITVPVQSVQALLDKVAHRKNWIPYLNNSQLLDSFSDTEKLEYSLFSAPWPASDRDFVYRITRLQHDPSRIVYAMASEEHPLMPEQAGLVRADLIESTYILTALPNGHSRVELIFQADPRGWLPTWIINIIQKVLPYMILRNLRTELLDPTKTIK
ncbi:MAG: START domain-containing protein [Gammaproteobacteria bacterium]|nr:START domain-containing protein [Gammaproteobacteria bacterium]